MVLKIGNRVLEYDENFETYALFRAGYHRVGISAAEDFEKVYYTCKNFDDLWEKFQRNIVDFIHMQCEKACALLFEAGIVMVDIDLFVEKYYHKYIDIDPHIEPIVSVLSQLSEYAEELRHIRSLKNANRAHWSGGGFGVAGAIKGAVTASAFNAIGGAFNAVGDAFRKSSDNLKIKQLKQELFENPKTLQIMCNAIINCNDGVFLALAEELQHHGRLDRVDIRSREAAIINRNAQKYTTDPQKRLELFLDSIYMDPFNAELYKPIFQEFSELKGLNDFAEYFGVAKELNFRRNSRINAKLNEIERRKENGIKEQCAKIIDLAVVAETEGLDLDKRIWDLARSLINENGQSSQKLVKILKEFEACSPSISPTIVVQIIDDIRYRGQILFLKEKKAAISQMSVYNMDDALKKITSLIEFSKQYDRNVTMELCEVFSKAIGYCQKKSDFVSLQEKLDHPSLNGNSLIKAVIEGCNCKLKMYAQESQISWHLIHVFSPALLDIVNLARTGNAACQLWLINSLCPDVILTNSIMEDGEKIKEAIQFLPSNLEDTISFLFDEPHKYPFDLFMRVRVNLIHEPLEDYCGMLEGFETCDTCPAGMFEYGKYAANAKIEGGLAAIERSAACGYYPAIMYICGLEVSKQEKLNRSILFYKVLGAGNSNYSDLYKFRYTKVEHYTRMMCLQTVMWNMANGYTSKYTSGIESLVRLIETIWQVGFASHMKLDIYKIGFHKKEKEDPHILEAIKFLGLRLQDEIPIFSFIEDWRSRDKWHEYLDQKVFLLTTKAAYWNKREKIYRRSYESVSLDECRMIPLNTALTYKLMWWQVFSIVYYATTHYKASIGYNELQKMALCGNPWAICRLMLFDEISEERRENWAQTKRRWEQHGQFYSVCPSCFEAITVDDVFCPECGARVSGMEE